MLFEEKVTTNRAAFLTKVEKISAELNINPDWLMAVMMHESGLNPSIRNSIGATGLIQFLPKTAAGLGTSTDALAAMTNVEQLDYVRKYYYPYRYRLKTFPDLYMAAFYPLYLGKAESEVIGSEKSVEYATKVAVQNPSFDTNNDRQITVGEFREAVFQYVPEPYRSQFRKEVKKK